MALTVLWKKFLKKVTLIALRVCEKKSSKIHPCGSDSPSKKFLKQSTLKVSGSSCKKLSILMALKVLAKNSIKNPRWWLQKTKNAKTMVLKVFFYKIDAYDSESLCKKLFKKFSLMALNHVKIQAYGFDSPSNKFF